ncbi:hypothetical protein Pcinc_009760 [Petrolisthes cinctipes]|uniref:Uncharacterized protein n=1 Tax=Petrolisthes cinctipes TaxID=88211 RepID=A0AAE1KV61_PETCI|nr:hypothetical protein Pcinc_009760 [Petrolisthes cinctipes]
MVMEERRKAREEGKVSEDDNLQWWQVTTRTMTQSLSVIVAVALLDSLPSSLSVAGDATLRQLTNKVL